MPPPTAARSTDPSRRPGDSKVRTQHALGWALVLIVIGVLVYAAVRGIPSATGIEREPAEDAPPAQTPQPAG